MTAPSDSKRLILAGTVIGLATLVVLLITEPRMAIVWDEGYTLGREARLREWFHALRDPARFAATWTPPAVELVQPEGAPPPRPNQIDTRGKLLTDPQVLAYFWPFAREEPHGHPPFYALLGLVGDVLTPTWQDLPRARLGPMLLFSVTAGFLFKFLARRWGTWAGIVGASAWLFQPNLFGHAHYATYDAILTSLWVLAIIAFDRAVAPRGDGNKKADLAEIFAILSFGFVVGCALATKLTGWFLPLPFIGWATLTRDRRAWRVLLIALPIAIFFLFLFNPPWWTEPIVGVLRFFQSNLTRGKTIAIPVQFLGTIYRTPNESLPWYNTLVWTVFVTPVGFLLLGIIGGYRAIRRWRVEPIGLLILANWLLLIILRALPHVPGHDGVRLFLPAFGMLALLAGAGAGQVLEWLRSRANYVLGAAVIEGIVSVLLLFPVPLSYYSPLVGGLPGAWRLGMEPTYYWDGLDREARDWLKANTGPGQTIQFVTFPRSWLYLRQINELPARLASVDRGRPTWYVLQNRPGAWSDIDRRIVERSTPVHQVTKLGVPLIWVYPFQEVESALVNPHAVGPK